MKIYIVDSFTDQPFKGNPAGVCITDIELSEEVMLSIAKELGFSETAFVQELEKYDTYSIRFFSPKREIPLCGHATLAASKVIFENMTHDKIAFTTIQQIRLEINRRDEQIIMEFPAYATSRTIAPQELLDALGISEPIYIAHNKETNILLIEIRDLVQLENLTPDFGKLEASTDIYNGVLVTTLSPNSDYDFYSRYFWPWSGTNEDPVTGGTHTFLTPYWSKRLNKKKMRSFQCSERTGFMEVEWLDNETVTIKGQAVLVLEGSMRI